ncbi:tRNA epoxyqueuosine(34) reductase QueG [Tropicimonas sp. TH_r6]|uniref:tRNA epoxyqueuosine(34) reductase QueG n=1 Tax=Tropicimonas sp. TH_r6 TaxID=3082085 RepID=UPI0029557C51|nr:tRNA epoxyqueuosine(34) reductase QueG [Tropicimonas sp. TH_r6]MDV7144077.1 tRNA epoxyqueuosine(34) reductase QueG [Tropicimonas sp. TH_r6]
MPISTSDPADLKARLARQASAEGFAEMRICPPDRIGHVPAALEDFVGQGFHGQMNWMAERMGWRGDPKALWPEVRSIIVLAEPYTSEEVPEVSITRTDRGTVSVYARGKDYHDLVKKRLKRLARWLIAEAGGEVKVFVDTAPVAEKPLGEAAGLGWQGKHTNLVSRDLGNWFFIGSVFTTLDLAPDDPEVDHCGSCRACLDACPTDAFVAPYRMDARRCISYLTIEHRGEIAPDLRAKMGNRIYGCDACLAACPWNKFAVEAREMRYAARDDLAAPKLAELAELDDAAFRARFAGSPIKRIGRDRFLRNVLYAIGNSGRPELREVAARCLGDADPVVSDAACWALDRLSRAI